jgi:flagellar hook-associated protein 3 FlgL
MRVTQSMLSNNMLRNLNTSYGKMSTLQDQINSGSKISRPSDDPIVATKGMDYRTQLTKNEQYSRNMNEVNSWLDTTDEGLDQVGNALHRVQELMTQAASDTNTEYERNVISIEIKQLQLQIRDVANTRVGNDYVFSGTNTNSPLFPQDKISNNGADAMVDPLEQTGLNNAIQVDVADGIQLKVNTAGYNLFKGIDEMLSNINVALTNTNTTGTDVSKHLENVQKELENVLTARAEIGASQNRAELMQNRIDIQNVNIQKQMSLNEDVDYSKAITDMTTAESIHQAALSTGAKIIQQTLVDFMR